MVSYTHQVSPQSHVILRKVPDLCHVQVSAKGWFIAMISTTVETDNPEAEIQPGLNLLGPITQKFIQVTLAIWP